MRLSKYIVVSPAFSDGGESQNIIFSTRTSQPHIVSTATLKILKASNVSMLTKEQREILADAKILVNENENELLTVIERNQKAIFDNETLSFVIQPTASCQLGCGYCGQIHSPNKLATEQQEMILHRLRLLLAAGSYKTLQIGWFGAEPLAGTSVITEMTPKLVSLAEEFNCSYSVKAMPTNGLQLNVDTAVMLHQQYHLTHFEITLDGTAEYHDSRRHMKNGKPTFEKIFQNILAIMSDERLSRVNISIRCNVDKQNVDGVLPLIHLLAKNNLQRRVVFYTAPIHSWGDNEAQLAGLSKEEYCDMELEWLAEMFELGFSLNLLPQQKPIVCLAVNKDGEMIDAYGNQYKCTEASYVPGYGDEYKIGQLTNSRSIATQETVLSNFNEEVLNGKYSCSICPMLPTCGGACPKEWHEGRVPCPTNKYNLSEKLLLYYAQHLNLSK